MKIKPKTTLTTWIPKRKPLPPGITRDQERDLLRMTRLIPDERSLISILKQTKPETREACYQRIKPYLRFKVSEDFQIPADEAVTAPE